MLAYDKMTALSVGSQDQLDGMAKYGFVTYDEERKIATIHADFLSLEE